MAVAGLPAGDEVAVAILHFHQASAQLGHGDERENHSRQDKQQPESHAELMEFTLFRMERFALINLVRITTSPTFHAL
jgi:hypothetical protein